MLSGSTLYARPSVCLSVTRVDRRKTVEVMIMKFLPYGSHIPLVLQGKFHPEILMGTGHQTREAWGGENKSFSSFKRQYLENGWRYVQIYCYND